jgi:TPR repeat protein
MVGSGLIAVIGQIGIAFGGFGRWMLVLVILAMIGGCARGPQTNRVQSMMLQPAREAERVGNDERAFELYKDVAEDGIVAAQYKLAQFYEKGRGTPQNDAEAARWYEAAATAGETRAYVPLARLYESGRGVPKDETRAHELYLQAVESGDAFAAYNVARFLEKGQNGTPDPEGAGRYYQIAAEVGHDGAQLALADRYSGGDGLAADPEKAEQLYAEAAKTVMAKAKSGNVYAQDRLGRLYLEGKGVPKDPKAGITWLNTAAVNGYIWAQMRLAQLFERGVDGVEPNGAMAARYYEMAAKQGAPGANYALAKIYAFSKDVARDGQRAAELFQQSAAEGNVDAYAMLGDLYGRSNALPRDDAEAVRWYMEGARHGDAKALFRLGEAYEAGRGVPQDPAQALMWYLLSEEQDPERTGDRVQQLVTELDPATATRAERLAEAWRRGNL